MKQLNNININNNSHINNDCNNSLNNNNKNNSYLFYKIFKNIYLKNKIFGYLKHYKLFKDNINFNSLEEFNEFKYIKEYFYEITISFQFNQFELIPENVKSIIFNYNNVDNITNLPTSINSVTFKYNISWLNIHKYYYQQVNSTTIFNNISTLRLENNGSNGIIEIPKFINLSNSITDLTLIKPKSILNKQVFPNNLKKIYIGSALLPLDITQLPESITDVSIVKSEIMFNKSGTGECGFINYNNLVNLNLSCDMFSDIPKGFIFPSSLKQLLVVCGTFCARLPNNLEVLTLDIDIITTQIELPSSIIKLSLDFYDCIVFNKIQQQQQPQPQPQQQQPPPPPPPPQQQQQQQQPYPFNIPSKLKYLKFNCTSLVDSFGNSILPDTLEVLHIINNSSKHGFNKKLLENQLPPNLKYLSFDSDSSIFSNCYSSLSSPNVFPSGLTHLDLGPLFNQVINDDVLPLNLNTLILGRSFNQIVKSLPSNLKLLEIKNPNYKHKINLINNPFTVIKCNNIICYYDQYNDYPEELRVLRLPNHFDKSISTLHLQNKINLEYLDLGEEYDEDFNSEIKLKDLPINNKIKTLILSNRFTKVINLDYFKNLKYIYINNSIPILITSKDNNNNNNFYNLKSIIIPVKNDLIIKSINPIFYPYINKINNDE